MLTIVKQILMEPKTFFSSLYRERGIKESFIFLGILMLFYVIVAGIMGWIVLNTFFADIYVLTIWKYIGLLLFVYFAALALSFVIAGIIFLWIKIWGGRNVSYDKAYQLYVFSRTPTMVFGWIPIVNYLIWIWSTVLLIIGTMSWFGIQRGKAILMYIIPILLILVGYLIYFVV